MSFKKYEKMKTVAIGLIVPILLVIFIEVICKLDIVPSQIVVPPHKVLMTLLELLNTGELSEHIRISFSRVLAGFILGASLGFMIGTVMALSKRSERIIAPLLSALGQVPLFGWIPLLMLWFGIGETFKVVFIAFGAFFPMLINTFEGIHGVPKSYLEVARAFEFNSIKLLRKVLLPSALPSLFTGIKLALGMSWMLVVGAELVAAGEGVGYLIVWGRQLFQMDIVFVGIAVVGFFGYLMFLTLNTLEASLMRWHRPVATNKTVQN